MAKFIVKVDGKDNEVEADEMQIDGNGHVRFVTDETTTHIFRDYQSAAPAPTE